MTRVRFAAGAILALLLTGVPAWAAPPAGSSATEQALAAGHTALTRYKEGDWQAALDGFREADRLAHSPVFTLFAARCERKLGHLLAARRGFRRVVDEKLGEDAPTAWRAAVADGRRELSDLDGRVPRLVVTVDGADSAQALVSLGKRTLGRAELGTPIEVDPGNYTLIARLDGREVRRDVRLTEGDATRVVLQLGAASRSPAPPAAHAGDTGSASSGDSPRSHVAPAIAFGVGAGGIVAGAVLAVLAASRTSDIKERCQGNSCLASDADEGATATRLANASTVAFAIGGLGVGTGVVLLLLPGNGGRERPSATARFGVRF